MDTEHICPSCQKPLPPNAPKGLCPECLMKAGFGTGVAPEPGQPSRTPAFVPPSAEEMARLFPQFEILGLLGQGGMGAVYKARQPALDRLVALKILPPQASGDPGFADRFTREARALARLNHPNIVGVHDFGQAGGLHYFVMEYVEGLNLRQVQQAGKLSSREALKIIPQICDALQFAHDEGIVHRDIKPENVMLDKKGRVKITDFGLAKILGREPEAMRLTGAKDVMGTPHYMAPEQIEHPQEVDHRADIYSLGVVFYEMLTGELPLGKFQAPSKKVQVDVRLDEVVLHALEKEPERRYQQASQVKTDVETIAASGVLPSRANRHGRAWKGATAIAAAAMILLAILVGAFFLAIGSPKFRKAANRQQASAGVSWDKAFAEACQAIESRESWPATPEDVVKAFWQCRAAKNYAELEVLWPGSASWKRGWPQICAGDGAETYVFGRFNPSNSTVPYACESAFGRTGSYNLRMGVGVIYSKAGLRYYVNNGNVGIAESKPATLGIKLLGFGPVREATLNDIDELRGGEALDFDSGQLVDLPKDIEKRPKPEQLQWLSDQSADLLLDRVGGRWGLMTTTTNELKLAPLGNESWDAVAEQSLSKALAAAPVNLEVKQRGPWQVYVLATNTQPPLTFAFWTATGTTGLLQIAGFTEQPNSVRLRYKLVTPSTAQTSTVTTVQPTGARPFAEAKPGEFRVTLTNGVEFEVVAIASSPRSSKVWWQPDGKLLAAPPGDEVRNFSRLCPIGGSRTEFAVLVKGAEKLRAEGNAVLALDPLPQYVASAILYTEKRLGQKQVTVAGYGAAPESLTCKVGLADGAWERVATWDQAGTLLDNESGGPLELMRSGTNDQTCLKVYHQIDANRYALRLTARLKDGTHKTAWIRRVEYGGEQRARTCAIIQGLQDSDVVAYELYRAPLRWAHIPGIATRPNVPPIQGNAAVSRPSGKTSQLDDLSEAERARALELFNDIEDFGHEWEAAFQAKNLSAAQTGTRRLLSLMTNFNAAVKGTGYEFPAGIFGDIAKVRQALDEGDWNKAQEAGRHNDQYAREFKRIGSRMVELAREQKGLAPSAFGPVMERAVPGESDKNKRFIDLDTGKQFAAAEFFGPKDEPSPEETQKWWKKTGIDAVGDTSPQIRGLVGFEMEAAPVPSEEWDRLAPGGLDYYLTMTAPGTPVTMSGRGNLPATFAVKTREGGRGLLQVLGFTNEPPSVRIRYKLIPPARTKAVAVAPAASARLVFPDPLRRYWRWQTERPVPARLIYGVLDVTDLKHPQQVVMGMEMSPAKGVQDYALRLNPERDEWRVEIEDAWSGQSGGRGATWQRLRCRSDAALNATAAGLPCELSCTNYVVLWKGELSASGRTLKSLWFVARLAEANDPITDILHASDAVRTFDGKLLAAVP